MKKLERLTLKDLGESALILDQRESASLIAGSGDGTYLNPYQLDEVEVTAYRTGPYAPPAPHSFDWELHNSLILVYQNDYNGGPVPIYSGGSGGGEPITEDQQRSLLNIAVSLLAEFLGIAEPILVGDPSFWRNYFGIEDPDQGN